MVHTPTTIEALREVLARASSENTRLPALDFGGLDRLVEHTPEDLTVTVEAGMTLAALQAALGQHGQWLPIDPPHAERLTIGRLLSENASGPRRFGCGTIREYLIGIKVILADGRLIKAGGKVVKNVAGYDLCKLFVGSHDSLGIIVEATFKLRPRPETERFVQATCKSLEHAGALIEAVLESELTPVVLDVHNFAPTLTAKDSTTVLVLGFAGTREEVDWQLGRARELNVAAPSSLDYEMRFWNASPPVQRLSVLPSRIIEAVHGLGQVLFVARAGNGTIFYRGGAAPPKEDLPLKLMQRAKDAYDPKHILAEFPREHDL